MPLPRFRKALFEVFMLTVGALAINGCGKPVTATKPHDSVECSGTLPTGPAASGPKFSLAFDSSGTPADDFITIGFGVNLSVGAMCDPPDNGSADCQSCNQSTGSGYIKGMVAGRGGFYAMSASVEYDTSAPALCDNGAWQCDSKQVCTTASGGLSGGVGPTVEFDASKYIPGLSNLGSAKLSGTFAIGADGEANGTSGCCTDGSQTISLGINGQAMLDASGSVGLKFFGLTNVSLGVEAKFCAEAGGYLGLNQQRDDQGDCIGGTLQPKPNVDGFAAVCFQGGIGSFTLQTTATIPICVDYGPYQYCFNIPACPVYKGNSGSCPGA